MSEVREFTPEEEALIPVVRDEWVKFAIGGDISVDIQIRDRIQWLYKVAGVAAPDYVLVVDSPQALQVAANILEGDKFADKMVAYAKDFAKKDPKGALASHQQYQNEFISPVVLGEERDHNVSLEVCIRRFLRNFLAEVAGKEVIGNKSRAALPDSNAMPDADVDAFIAEMRAEFKGFKLQYRSSNIGIMSDAGWSSFYDFFTRIGVVNHENFNKWLEFLHCGPWEVYAFNECAVVCRRPLTMIRDKEGRLHNQSGPCVTWADGWSSYCWHGIEVDPNWIYHPETITVKQILDQQNVEVRRVMMEMIGFDRFARESEMKVLDTWVDGGGVECRLLRIDLEDDEPIVLYEWCCPSTLKRGVLRVDPQCESCKQAVAWTFGVDPQDYKPLVEA